ncbi:DUF4136 domain-containing protein [Thalassotalea nanhaiensis]|uniref:DUF4136 domain-containing protein n=1 Tax=Thalassotalea nanhaiensis TaxID=3065648 RepID=A0ABY9TJY3_9GAMM|nr:DUF4136 domain-containing protein [Colwelliaceae bacterium SQ345]
MMNRFSLFFLCFAFLAGCSSSYEANTDYKKEYDFSKVGSYFVIADKGLKNPMLSDIDRGRISYAIDSKLQKEGFKAAGHNSADILISYFVITKDKVKVTSYVHNPRYVYAPTYDPGISAKDYTEGTFVLDFIDNKTKQTVWRSTLTKPLKTFDSIEQRDQAIAELINKMLAELPK